VQKIHKLKVMVSGTGYSCIMHCMYFMFYCYEKKNKWLWLSINQSINHVFARKV